jgi:hypothetical protein
MGAVRCSMNNARQANYLTAHRKYVRGVMVKCNPDDIPVVYGQQTLGRNKCDIILKDLEQDSHTWRGP